MQEQILAMQMKRLAFGKKSVTKESAVMTFLALKTKAAIVKLS